MDNKDNIKTLLLLYKQHPSLYVVKSAEYHNRTKREIAYREICEQYQEITKQPLTVEAAKKKINNLRSQYLDYINKIKASKSSGMSTNDIYKPTWWLFDDMKFLDPHIAQRKGESSVTMYSQQRSYLESSTQEESDNEDIQFVDVVDILKAQDSNKENTESNLQPIPSCSTNSLKSKSVTSKHRKRKFEILSNDSSKDEFWTKATNAIQSISQSDDTVDELKYWILYLESKLRKIKDPKTLNYLQRNITLIDDINI